MKYRVKPDTARNIPRSITFPRLHFMLNCGKWTTFGTVYRASVLSNLEVYPAHVLNNILLLILRSHLLLGSKYGCLKNLKIYRRLEAWTLP